MTLSNAITRERILAVLDEEFVPHENEPLHETLNRAIDRTHQRLVAEARATPRASVGRWSGHPAPKTTRDSFDFRFSR